MGSVFSLLPTAVCCLYFPGFSPGADGREGGVVGVWGEEGRQDGVSMDRGHIDIGLEALNVIQDYLTYILVDDNCDSFLRVTKQVCNNKSVMSRWSVVHVFVRRSTRRTCWLKWLCFFFKLDNNMKNSNSPRYFTLFPDTCT